MGAGPAEPLKRTAGEPVVRFFIRSCSAVAHASASARRICTQTRASTRLRRRADRHPLSSCHSLLTYTPVPRTHRTTRWVGAPRPRCSLERSAGATPPLREGTRSSRPSHRWRVRSRNATCPTEDTHYYCTPPSPKHTQPHGRTQQRNKERLQSQRIDKWLVIKITGFWWVHSGGAAASLPPPHKSALDGEHEPSGGRFIRRSRTGCGPGA